MNDDSTTTTDLSGEFARTIFEPDDEVSRLQLGVDLIVQLVPSCDDAGVTILGATEVRTDAATSDRVWRGDRLQYELNEGPCLDAVTTHGTVISNDVAMDRRWPRWGPTVAQQLGVASMMSLLLYTDRGEIGALNLYANQHSAYTADDLAIAETLAAHLAVAVAGSRAIEQRTVALTTRTVIGQAEGMLMERYGISADQAFDVLRRISQSSNRKLNALAAEFVATGHLDGLPHR